MRAKKEHLSCIAHATNMSIMDDNGIEFQTPSAQTEIPDKWSKSEVTYCLIRGSEDISDDSSETQAMNLAMTTWDVEIPLVLKVVKRTENPDITVEFSDSMHDSYFRDNFSVLAYAYYPNTLHEGIIKFNDDKLWSLDGKPIPAPYDPSGRTKFKTYNLLSTLIHEIGHSLGLSHSEGSALEETIMYPMYNSQLELADHDIQRIVAKYGAREWSNSVHYERLKNWLYHRVRRFDSSPSPDIASLTTELDFLKTQLKSKDAIIMEQLKVIMNLAGKLKK